MSEKKARASVFFVIAIIAFICSCILFSMTGGVSDWFGDFGMNDTDNTTDELGLTEFLNQTDSSYDNSNDNKDSSKFLDDLSKKDKNSSDSSSDSKKDSKKSDSGEDSGKSDSDKTSPEGSDSGEDSTHGPIKLVSQ